jgi:UDP-N-acetylglucosamine--dolichyl-phosphate N-acetylglucosaminephosphotransferase
MILGFVAATTIAGLLPLEDKTMLAILLSSLLGVFIGLLDDLFTLSRTVLVALTFFAGIPVVTFGVGSPIIHSWPGGPLDMGPFFWILVPLTFAFLMNGVNIYAGFNGLEAGLGLITATSLGLSALILGSQESTLALLILSAVLLAFLRWNYSPAKIFPGNSGTYLIGAVLAAAIIVGDIRIAGVIAASPYIANFLLRLRHGFRWTVGETHDEETVTAKKLDALWAIWIYRSPRRETHVVLLSWLLQLSPGIVAVAFSLHLGGL